jgi:uncharacterized protein (TIGR00303 family)
MMRDASNPNTDMIRCYTEADRAQAWLHRYAPKKPIFVGVMGFTETALIPGISAAGKTPEDRSRTAHGDAEFLVNGVCDRVTYPLPPLVAGASPTLISRAILQALKIQIHLVNVGLPAPLSVPSEVLESDPARCLATGNAMDLQQVEDLFRWGMSIGSHLSSTRSKRYIVLGECVVGGTTTALAALLGLGIDAAGLVNSSHPTCNHDQKLQVAQTGLDKFWATQPDRTASDFPIRLLAAIGDPMQPFAAGFTIGASRLGGVLLAGGTQMLAVYALAQAFASVMNLRWIGKDNVVVGTTRWVAEDPTGNTVGLAQAIGDVPLIATQLNFEQSRFEALRAYEKGFVKEGVGAGGCAIVGALYQNWQNDRMVQEIETLTEAWMTVQRKF